jgi:hypothetical protein
MTTKIDNPLRHEMAVAMDVLLKEGSASPWAMDAVRTLASGAVYDQVAAHARKREHHHRVRLHMAARNGYAHGR